MRFIGGDRARSGRGVLLCAGNREKEGNFIMEITEGSFISLEVKCSSPEAAGKVEVPGFVVGGKKVGAPRGGILTAECNICPIQT